ncbi:MAG TPA: hypothetical protein VI248_05255 [Kineosporiaceae bacterium]
MQTDLLLVGGAAVLSAIVIVARVPFIQPAVGVVLLLLAQGAALGLALLPTEKPQGFTPMLLALGTFASAAEAFGLSASVGITRLSVSLTATVVTVEAVLAAGLRKRRPHLAMPCERAVGSVVVVAGTVAMIVFAVVLGRGIPIVANQAYSTVSFAEPIASTHGVVELKAGEGMPIVIRLANRDGGNGYYSVALKRDDGAQNQVTHVRVPTGQARNVRVGTASANDGCLHRFAIHVRSEKAYVLTLYLRASDRPCQTPGM